MEIELGRAKRARRAYTFDDIAVVPSRRTRNPEDVSTAWSIDAFQFAIPVLGAPMDSVVSPRTAIMLGQLGGLGVLDLEGVWTRYDDPEPLLAEIASLEKAAATRRMQELYSEPIKPELVRERLAEIRAAGVTVAGALTPQRTQELYETVVAAGVDLFVIRGTTVSAEHVSSVDQPLNLKKFIYDLDVPVIVGGAATYTAALHLMRTGAAGVLVGFGGGAASTTRATLGIHAPMATAVADVAGARRDYLDESGGRYVHVIADGGVGTSGDIVKALAMGADAVMLGVALARATDAPGLGYHWGPEAHHSQAAARAPRARRPGRLARGGPVRTGADRRRHREPHRGAAQVDGHDRVLRPQGVPARRGRRRALQRRMTIRPTASRSPVEVFPPTLREVMLRPRWIGMLLLCLVVAGVFAWLGQWQLGRAIETDPTPPGATEEVRADRGRRRPRAPTCPSLSSGSASTSAAGGSARTSSSSSPGSTTASRATGSPASCGCGTASGGFDASDEPVSLAVAIGWAPTLRRGGGRGIRSRRRSWRRARRPRRSSSPDDWSSDEGPALPPRGADPQTHDDHVVGGAARTVARRRPAVGLSSVPRLG